MMRAARLALPALLAAAAMPAVAAAQSAPPPTPSAGVAAPASPTVTPPAAAEKKEAYGLQDAGEHMLRATQTIFNGAGAGASPNPSATIARDVKRVNGYFDKVGDGLTLIDVGVAGYEVGTEINQGNYGAAARKGAAAVIDQCIGAAIAAGCTAATVGTTGPGAVFAEPLCVAAVTTVVEYCDHKLEQATGMSMSETVVDWGVKGGAAAIGAMDSAFGSAERDFGQARASADAKRMSMSDANQAALAEQAAQEQAARDAAAQAASGANDALFFNNLMMGLGLSFAPPPVVPLAPASGPSGCHPGHDEAAHPGGCHSPRGGTAN